MPFLGKAPRNITTNDIDADTVISDELTINNDATVSGDLTVTGNVQIDGTQTVINTATLDIEDKNITVAKNSANSFYADGGGLTVDIGVTGANATLTYSAQRDGWVSNKDFGIGVDPAQRLDVREEKTGGGVLVQVYNEDNSDTTTQTAGIALGPDTRGATARIIAVKENADFSTNAGRDVSLTFSSVLNNSPTEAMRITSSGNVGIGTTPARALDVSSGAAGVAITTKGSGTGSYITFQDGTTTDDAKVRVGAVGDNLTLFGGGSERVRIDSDGNVDIGSISNHAGARVVINDTPPTAFGSPMFQVGQETFTASGYYSIGLGYTAASYTEPPAEIAAVSTSSSGGTTADIVFGTRSVTTNTAVTERMRIDSSGKVLIGTDSGDAFNTNSLLRIQQASNPVYLQIKGDNDQTVGLLFGDTDDDFRGGFFYENTTDELAVYTNDAERMRIKSDGKIGIGNTAPLAMLQITGTGDLLRLESTNAGTSGAQLDLIHFSASPANDDTVGVINFSGYDGGNNPTQYASLKGVAGNVSTEEGVFQIGLRLDGSNFHHSRLKMTTKYNQFVGEHGDGYLASLMTTPDGGTSDKYSGIAFKATFGSYPADTTPRRAADIWGGFTGTWNTEFMSFGAGNAGSSNDAGDLTDEKMRILSTGVVRAAESYKFNMKTVVTYDNGTTNTVQTGMNNQVFVVSIHHSAGVSAILCLPNGGSGVAYDFQMTDPDSGTIANTNSVTFTMAGTGGSTFNVQILGGSGNVTVRRINGSGSFTVYINQILGGLV